MAAWRSWARGQFYTDFCDEGENLTVTATFFLAIELALFQATFGSVRLGSVRVDSNYPAARTADCTDQSNGWDEFAFAAAPLDIAATDTQQGDACLDSSAVWPEESLP